MAKSEKKGNETKTKTKDSGGGRGEVLLGLAAAALGAIVKVALETHGTSPMKAELAGEATKQVVEKAPEAIKKFVEGVEIESPKTDSERSIDWQMMM
jgi:hypothetical protein